MNEKVLKFYDWAVSDLTISSTILMHWVTDSGLELLEQVILMNRINRIMVTHQESDRLRAESKGGINA